MSLFASVSAQAAPPVEDYGKLPGIQYLALSPSGESYAFVASVADRRALYVFGADNKPVIEEGLGEIKVQGLHWAGDGHLVVETSATVSMDMDFVRNRSELSAAIIVNASSGKSFAVFGDVRQTQVAHAIEGDYGAAFAEGHWYEFFGGFSYEQDRLKTSPSNAIYADLYRVDLDTGEFKLAGDGLSGTVIDWLIGPTGEILARERMNSDSGVWSVLGARDAVLLSGRAPDQDAELLGLGRVNSNLLVDVSDRNGERIVEIPFAGGSAVTTQDRRELGDPLFDRISRLWIGARSEDDASAFDAAREAKLRGAFKAFPRSGVRLVSANADFNRMIVLTDGADDSGTYWLVDVPTGSAKEIGWAYPTIKATDVGTFKWFDYKAADGLPMRGVLTLPPGRPARNLPLVVLPHGGPQDHDFPHFDFWAQAFASRGYVVFQPNFRGSDGSGVAFIDAGHGQWGRKMQTDISDGVAELARQGIVDPKRACIVGASYGGYAALAGVTIQQGLYRCAVSFGGVSDLAAQYQYLSADSANVVSRTWKDYLGLSSSEGNRMADLSPIKLAARADAPILLLHGKDDTVVPEKQSEAMAKALQAAGKAVTLVPLAGGDHWLSREDERVAMVKASVGFVLTNNPPDPEPAAAH